MYLFQPAFQRSQAFRIFLPIELESSVTRKNELALF